MSNKKKSSIEKNNKIKKKTVTPTVVSKSKTKLELQEAINELDSKVRSLTELNRIHKRKIFDLYTIFEISRNFNTLLDYHQLLDTFIFTSLAQVGSMKAAFYLPSRANEKKYILTKYKGSGKFPSKDDMFDDGTKMLNNLAKINRPSKINELINTTANSKEKKIFKLFENGLVIPLLYQSELTGLFIISDKLSSREFTADDIEFLSILGNQISVAIENTWLFEAEKRATKQLRETQQQLVHSERLAALGEMSAKVAHEINNPLGIIKNYLYLTNKLVVENDNATEYLDIVNSEIDRIAKIVSELLDFHRPRGFEFQKTDITKLASSVISLMSRQFEKNKIIIEQRFDPNTPEIEISPESIKQVFLNLIINAYDAMPNGGKLRISIKPLDDEISIRFSDTGPGIPPEMIPKIFEPFFTTKESTKGTGLGLSVCYGIIKKNNGSITFYNQEIGGCFEIKLPYVNKDRTYEPNI